MFKSIIKVIIVLLGIVIAITCYIKHVPKVQEPHSKELDAKFKQITDQLESLREHLKEDKKVPVMEQPKEREKVIEQPKESQPEIIIQPIKIERSVLLNK